MRCLSRLYFERGIFDLAGGTAARRVTQGRGVTYHLGRAVHGYASNLIDNAVQENSVAIIRHILFAFAAFWQAAKGIAGRLEQTKSRSGGVFLS